MYTELLQLLTVTAPPQEQERSRRRLGALTQLSLRDENVLFARTRGLSENNAHLGFVPGYRDSATGQQVLSCFADGSPAPVHLLDGLPEAWVAERDSAGHVTRTCPDLVSGFIRDGRFYTREEAIRAAIH
ncbi:MAG TPA: hypothetical protein VES73_09730 [Lamprocystis sp. (in: g-proteobacteria)]|nr:hypothetical protein [Lamprocystis sp. (in: g-proteobacteria)]